ncbi:hypothetical protein [Mucilaginibacter sp. SG564]|uniref:hypothetical protein n=1 Tax=Mucilaginibacter sp. SG564 TaxID=2587022 RepID=UPI0015581CC0|nr:hypothetical protein [Mucilaginibacter sp. SG564]NOW95840.1 hypothetical protein [Mucilaginibacter sp. SG564]
METKEVKNGAETVNVNTNTGVDKMRPSIPAKDGKNEPAKNQPTAQDQQLASPAQAVASSAGPGKKELKDERKAQNVRGLDDTVKLVETLGKKISQKNKLTNTISNLDSFIVAQNDDKEDVAGDSKFPRCELVISDDGGEEFVTKNPFIIARVVDVVKQLCIEKLAEVEATIVIP